MEHRQINVIADAYIPYLDPLESRPNVVVHRLEPEQFTREAVHDADALLVRTRTRCDATLLAGSRVSFVGTATIGLDHIDGAWCDANGIEWCNAPGCNAPAVAQYVLASLLTIHGETLAGRTLGVVGAGHVGSITARWAEGLGMRVLCCDPPRARREGPGRFVTYDELLCASDIVTLHTPLTRTGTDATFHLLGTSAVARMRHGVTVVNAARGPVADTQALLRGMEEGRIRHAVIDTWEGEPRHIDAELMARADIATPHIAGYSEAGKRRASSMVLGRLYSHFGLGTMPVDTAIPPVPERVTAEALRATCDPVADTAALRSSPMTFERLRDTYRLRREPSQA